MSKPLSLSAGVPRSVTTDLSGTGEINAILNPSADKGLVGYTNGTSHTATRITTGSPLDPAIKTAISIAATTTASESSTSGVYYTVSTVPTGIRNKKLKVEFYFTTEASQTWAVGVYSGSTRMALSTDSSGATLLPAGTTGKYTTYFDADSSSSYTVHLTRTAGSGTATLIVTGLILGPGVQVQGAVAGPVTSFTPSFNNTTGFTTTAYGQWQRIGDCMLITLAAYFNGTGSSGSNFQFNIPGGYHGVTGTYGGGLLGLLTADKQSRNVYVVANSSNTYVEFSNQNSPASLFTGSAVGSGTSQYSDWQVSVLLPIAEWVGSGTVDLAQNDVEYAFNTSTSDADDTTSFGYGSAGTSGPGTLTAPRNKRVRFQSPIQKTDRLVIEFANTSAGPWLELNGYDINTGVTSLIRQGTAYYGIGIKSASINGTDVDITFGTYAGDNDNLYFNTGQSWGGTTILWRIRKEKIGAAVGFGLADRTSAGLVKQSKFQKKVLSSNFTGPSGNATEVTDLTFSTLTIGKVYRVSVTSYNTTAGHLYISWGTGSDTTTYTYHRLSFTNSAVTNSVIFTAIQTGVKVYYSSDSGSGVLVASDNNNPPSGFTTSPKTTYIIVEELNNYDTSGTL